MIPTSSHHSAASRPTQDHGPHRRAAAVVCRFLRWLLVTVHTKAIRPVTSCSRPRGSREGIILTPEHLPWYSRPWDPDFLLSSLCSRHLQPRLHTAGPLVVWLFPLLFQASVILHTLLPLPETPSSSFSGRTPAHGSRPVQMSPSPCQSLSMPLTEWLELCRPSAPPTPSNRHILATLSFISASSPLRKIPFSLKANTAHVYTEI